MAKRRSLQSIFVPAFFHLPNIEIITESIPPSRQNSPPPDFLLDDDPFANLSAPSLSSRSSISDPTPTPLRSPLSPNSPDSKHAFLSSPSRAPLPPSASRVSPARLRPAYQKPAFPPRPSLPSLNTLAQMDAVLPPKTIRKGRVGAGLPSEPWDNLPSTTTSSASSIIESPESEDSFPTAIIAPSSSSQDFVADLDLDLLEFVNFAIDPAPADPLEAPPHPHSPVEHNPSPAPSSVDLETFLHDEYLPALLLASPPLTRSTSTNSTSSSDSLNDHLWSSTSGHNTSISSVDESDLSSPHEVFALPKFFHPPSASWSPTDLFSSAGSTHHFFTEPKQFYDPGTPARTLPPLTELRRSFTFPPITRGTPLNDEPMDGGEGHQGYSTTKAQWNGGNTRGVGNSPDDGGGMAGGSGSHGSGGRGDDGDDEKRFNPSIISSPSDSEASASEDADEDLAGDAEKPSGANKSSSDDDIPLAQRIPTALKAQKTIRLQVRQEREQRRKARALRAAEATSSSPQSALRPLLPGPSVYSAIPSSSQQPRSLGRPRTKTLPGTQPQPFSPQDLSKKLQGLDVNPLLRHQQSLSRHASKREQVLPEQRPRSAGRSPRDPGLAQQHVLSPPRSPPENFRSLHRMQSLRQAETSKLDVHRAIPMPSDAEQKLARNASRVRPREEGLSPRPVPTRWSQQDSSPRTPSRRSGEDSRKQTKPYPESKATRTSGELERQPRPSLQRPPVPPLPVGDILNTPPQFTRSSALPIVQQRVFIGDMQRFNIVEISPSTSAGDVIEMAEAQGSLKGWVGSGDWMVWEVAQDFGMERPIRSFELLADVQASWNQDKLMNTFVLRLTPLAASLSRSAIPTASPTHAGYVEWESKRGKWSKRWLQLREHSLWMSKRDKGRDEVLLCSLSSFDAYSLTRPYKAPRPFSFAVKSTDNITFFENKADYLHIFSCSEKEGKIWMEKILLARSYVLHQEKHVLFNPKASNGNSAGGTGNLTRSITRKPSTRRPAQPLVIIPPPHTLPQNANDVFEPGSLLARHT